MFEEFALLEAETDSALPETEAADANTKSRSSKAAPATAEEEEEEAPTREAAQKEEDYDDTFISESRSRRRRRAPPSRLFGVDKHKTLRKDRRKALPQQN